LSGFLSENTTQQPSKFAFQKIWYELCSPFEGKPICMKKTGYITRLFSASLAVLLLFLATAGQTLGAKSVVKKPVAEQKTSKDNNSDEQPVLQSLSLEAVVSPALSFDFQQDFYFLPAVFYIELSENKGLFKRFDVFYYFFSFFRNVFGFFIVTNAP
jgi:hypothetical protein